MRRAALWLGAGLLALELLYLVVANLVLASQVLQGVLSTQPLSVEVAWASAYSPWPGRGYVSGFRMRVQDPRVQFLLTVDSAKADVVLWDLLHKRFRASRVQAEGVSYRLLTKVETTAGQERRVAAFPPLAGFERPALLPRPMPSAPTAAEIDALWTVQLDDVDAGITELWLLEYRYHGAGRVNGAFALSPFRSVWVRPAVMRLEGGELSAGGHVISQAFSALAEVSVAPVDLRSTSDLIRALTTSIQFDATLDGLRVAELYLDGLRARGTGRLTVKLQIADGRLKRGSAVEARLEGLDAQLEGLRFTGDSHAKVSVEGGESAPTVRAALTGTLKVPLLDEEAISVALSGVTAELVFAGNDLSQGLNLRRAHAVLGEARVLDVRAITHAISKVVPIFAPFVLGEGPLIASATAYVTPDYALVRLKHLNLGDAELEGAAIPGAGGWSGAAAGHFGVIPFGLRLQHGGLESVLFTPASWLTAEYFRAGIQYQ